MNIRRELGSIPVLKYRDKTQAVWYNFLMNEQKTRAIEIIKNQISSISPTLKSQAFSGWTEREVAAGVMAGQFVKMVGKGLSEEEAEALKNEIKMAALEAAK
jgi:hypothetical protein